jgi:hypothetical protein
MVMTENKAELRKVKIARNMSEETTAFTADLWFNGELIGYCKNSGQGGATFVTPAFGKNPSTAAIAAAHAKVDEFESWCETLPPNVSKYGTLNMDSDLYLGLLVDEFEMDSDFFIGKLLDEWEVTKFLKRKCKTNLVAIMKGNKEGDFSIFKQPYTPEWAAKFRAHHGDKVVEIINERFLHPEEMSTEHYRIPANINAPHNYDHSGATGRCKFCNKAQSVHST